MNHATHSRNYHRTSLGALTMVGLMAALPTLSEKAQAQQPAPSPVTVNDPMLGQRGRGLGDARSKIKLGAETWVISSFRDAYLPTSDGNSATYRPRHLPHFHKDPQTGSLIIGEVVGKHPHGDVGVRLIAKWTTTNLMELIRYDCIYQDRNYLKGLNVPDDNVSAEPFQNRGAIFYLRDSSSGEVVSNVAQLFSLDSADGADGIGITLFMPPDKAASFIKENGNGFTLCAAFLPYGYNTVVADQKWEASQSTIVDLKNTLTNEQLANKAPIFQNDANKVYQKLAVAIRAECFISGKEGIPLVDNTIAEALNQFLHSSVLEGQAAVDMTKDPAYQQMMSTWLESLRTRFGVTKDTVDLKKTNTGSQKVTTDKEGTTEGSSSNDRLSILLGLLGSFDFTTLNGKEVSKETINKIIDLCEKETGTTLRESNDVSGYVIHSVRVFKHLESEGTGSIRGCKVTTLATGETSGYIGCRPMPADITDVEINKAVADALKTLKGKSIKEEQNKLIESERIILRESEEKYRELQINGRDLFRQVRDLETALAIERDVLQKLKAAATVIAPIRQTPPPAADPAYPEQLTRPIVADSTKKGLEEVFVSYEELTSYLTKLTEERKANLLALQDYINSLGAKRQAQYTELTQLGALQAERLGALALADQAKAKAELDAANARQQDLVAKLDAVNNKLDQEKAEREAKEKAAADAAKKAREEAEERARRADARAALK